MNRTTDDREKTFFRSERFFLSQEQWFCTTREGTILGPYPQRSDAVAGLRKYLTELGVRVDEGVWGTPWIAR